MMMGPGGLLLVVPPPICWCPSISSIGGVAKKEKNLNLDVKNIFAWSHVEHCWRWLKSYAFMSLKSSFLCVCVSLSLSHTHLLGAPILGPLQVFTNKESRSKHHKIHILHFFLAI